MMTGGENTGVTRTVVRSAGTCDTVAVVDKTGGVALKTYCGTVCDGEAVDAMSSMDGDHYVLITCRNPYTGTIQSVLDSRKKELLDPTTLKK